MAELENEILDMAQVLRDKITELTDIDSFDFEETHTVPYQKLNNALCDFIGDY